MTREVQGALERIAALERKELYMAPSLAREALASLSRLAEPGEDAQKLAHELHDKCMTLVNPNSLCDYEVELDTTMAAALIERYVAAQVAKAREEERKACAERAIAWQKKLCADDDWPCRTCTECDQLRAAIKEARNGNA